MIITEENYDCLIFNVKNKLLKVIYFLLKFY